MRASPRNVCLTAQVLVIYYSEYGHVHALAKAVADGARGVPGTIVTVCQKPV